MSGSVIPCEGLACLRKACLLVAAGTGGVGGALDIGLADGAGGAGGFADVLFA
jgi:hypothetical protein